MDQDLVDVLRAGHLIFMALGMGTGLFCDWRALCAFNTPFTAQHIAQFDEVHKFVFAALAGLWLTGAGLIYVRTGFVLSEFSPKLWLKVIVVTTLTVNAVLIGAFVLPRVARSVGTRAIALPGAMVAAMTFTTSVSLFCWMSGLALGVSTTLKTADWTTLGMVFASAFGIFVAGGMAAIMGLRAVLMRAGGQRQGQRQSEGQMEGEPGRVLAAEGEVSISPAL